MRTNASNPTMAAPKMTVTMQAKICADWFQRMIDREFEQAERFFQQDVKDGRYANAYARSLARLVRADMQKTMLTLITEACQGADPVTALGVVKQNFQSHLLETVKRNDGTPEEIRVQGLRAENQGWAIATIDSILLALRSVPA